jgi:hypothetical protein
MCADYRSTLLFAVAHLHAVRDAIKTCFESYQVLVKLKLSWLFPEDSPEEPSKQLIAKAKPLNTMLARKEKNDRLSFNYTSGKQAHGAGAEISSRRLSSMIKKKISDWGLSGLCFAKSLLFRRAAFHISKPICRFPTAPVRGPRLCQTQFGVFGLRDSEN